MGREFELKFAATALDHEALLARFGNFSPITMETTYYDTPDGDIRRLRWTLRRRLENGISVMGLPIQGIVLSFSDGILEQTGFLPQVRCLWEQDLCADALQGALSESGIRRWMEEEEYRLLDDFFAQLGSENREREGERCAYIHARLRNLRDEAASDLSARCRIARTLAGAVGCAAALMLLWARP